METYALLKGTSGTGKGTRVFQLMSYLFNEAGYKAEKLQAKMKGKKKPFGVLFTDINVIFLGKWVVSNKSGLKSWSSLDAINAGTGKTDLTIALVKRRTRGMHVVAEGEPMIISHKYRPEVMFELYPDLERCFFQIFNYAEREQYDERILNRSGKLPGDSGWGRNKDYKREHERVLSERKDLNMTGESDTGKELIHCEMLPHDAPVTCFGVAYLKFLGMDDHIKAFKKYAKKHPALRGVGKGV